MRGADQSEREGVWTRKGGRTHRAVVPLDVRGRAELRQDVLREDLAELNTHLIYTTATDKFSAWRVCRQDVYSPNELIPQTTPCVKILCSYSAMSAPSVAGVRSGKMIELLGRLPSKILDLTSASDALAPSSYMTDTRSAPEYASKHGIRATDLADLILSLSERQSFGLSEEVA